MKTQNVNKIRTILNLIQDLPLSNQKEEKILLATTGKRETPEQVRGGRLFMTTQKAFTLIELLVVVLIIGILAAVALPQYEKAVEKARATEALTLLKATYQAANVYYLANGEWPTKLEDLDIVCPWSGTTTVSPGSDGNACSNENWSLQITHGSAYKGIQVRHLDGKYKGGAFAIYKQFLTDNNINNERLLCLETKDGDYTFSGDEGSFCIKLFKGQYVTTGGAARYYQL